MLVLSRKGGESLHLRIDPSDYDKTLGEFFKDNPIVVHVTKVDRLVTKIGIDAPRGIKILRSELLSSG